MRVRSSRSKRDGRSSSTRLLFAVAGALLISAAGSCQAVDIINSRELADRIYEYRMRSPSMGQIVSFSVVLPPDYTESGPPSAVVYLLHGAGRHHLTLVTFDTTRPILLDAPFVTVMPNGEGGWWIDSPTVSQSEYETLVTETIAAAEQQLNIARTPSSRGITGWSMGGFGAMRYAQRHAERFAGVATILGLLDFPNYDLPPEQNHSVPSIFGNSREVCESFNPLPHVENVLSMDILLLTADNAFDFTMNENFHARLVEMNKEHGYVVFEGAHTFDIVEQSLPHVVSFFTEILERPSCVKGSSSYK